MASRHGCGPGDRRRLRNSPMIGLHRRGAGSRGRLPPPPFWGPHGRSRPRRKGHFIRPIGAIRVDRASADLEREVSRPRPAHRDPFPGRAARRRHRGYQRHGAYGLTFGLHTRGSIRGYGRGRARRSVSGQRLRLTATRSAPRWSAAMPFGRHGSVGKQGPKGGRVGPYLPRFLTRHSEGEPARTSRPEGGGVLQAPRRPDPRKRLTPRRNDIAALSSISSPFKSTGGADPALQPSPGSRPARRTAIKKKRPHRAVRSSVSGPDATRALEQAAAGARGGMSGARRCARPRRSGGRTTARIAPGNALPRCRASPPSPTGAGSPPPGRCDRPSRSVTARSCP